MKFIRRKNLPLKILREAESSLLSSYRNALKLAFKRLRPELLSSAKRVSADDLVRRQTVKTSFTPYLSQQLLIKLSPSTFTTGSVTSISPSIQVDKEDGTSILIKDLSSVCDLGGNMSPNSIILSNFDVLIPEGSRSFEIETSLEKVTAEMNRTPLSINRNAWVLSSAKQHLVVDDLIKNCQTISSSPSFRPNAREDCISEFLKKRGLPVLRVTPRGSPALDKEVLEMWANMGDDLAHATVLAREAISIKSQLSAWKPYADSGYVQCNWLQYGTPHGRYSSDSPNLQNRVLEIRDSVVPQPSYSFLSFDWAAAEYVTWASLSKDTFLSSIFSSGKDIHSEMGSYLSPLLDPSTDVRKAGKTVNFALLYGMMPVTLGKLLSISPDKALALKSVFESKSPLSISYRDSVISSAIKKGYVETFFGRRRMIHPSGPWGSKDDGTIKTAWHHVNAGTAAELLKIKMVEQWNEVRKSFSYDDARIVLNMHDEVIWEVRTSLLPTLQPLLLSIMSSPIPSFLPFKVDCRVGQSWLEISK